MYQVEMTFGHADCNGRPVRPEQIEQAEAQVLHDFARRFHGAQLHRHQGSYLNNDSSITEEPGTTVWAYARAHPPVAPLCDLADEIAARLHQESILLVITELPGHMYWVYPGPSGE